MRVIRPFYGKWHIPDRSLAACCSAQDTYVPARGKAVVKTGLSIAIPAETYARIAPRSGLAVKHFIDTGAGVVDEDYRGEVGVVLFNHSDVDFQGEELQPLCYLCPLMTRAHRPARQVTGPWGRE